VGSCGFFGLLRRCFPVRRRFCCRRRCWRSRDSSSTLPLHKIDDIFKFFLMIWHIQVWLKQIAALVNGIYKCGYIAAFILLDLQVRVDQMRL